MTLGDHGLHFVPDSDGAAEAQSLLVRDGGRNDTFREALDLATARARAMGASPSGMNFRVRLRGRIVQLPERLSGYSQGFQVDEVVAIEACPRRPQSLDGCSN